jgi:hypothetical protein
VGNGVLEVVAEALDGIPHKGVVGDGEPTSARASATVFCSRQ